jgi:hypothetical protein
MSGAEEPWRIIWYEINKKKIEEENKGTKSSPQSSRVPSHFLYVTGSTTQELSYPSQLDEDI